MKLRKNDQRKFPEIPISNKLQQMDVDELVFPFDLLAL